MEKNNDIRTTALAQLKQALIMLHEGRKELAAANEKISAAQQFIDKSADALRNSPLPWEDRVHPH
jgi:hypothetical protein